MSEEKWRRFIQNEVDKEMQEIDGILDRMNTNPKTKDLVAPEELHEKLFAQITEAKAEQARLSDEEKELIRLGKVYKKSRQWNKLLVLAAAVVCALAVGVTSFGGPKKVIEKVQGMLESRERINNDTEDDGRVDEIEVASEAEAYQKIEDEFGFRPVRLDYLPEGMEFVSYIPADNAQNVCMCYEGDDKETIVYFIYPNYRTGSMGLDVEDTLIDEYEKVVHDNTINVKKYFIEDNQTTRYKIHYAHQSVYYTLEINFVVEDEVQKIVENLYFASK